MKQAEKNAQIEEMAERQSVKIALLQEQVDKVTELAWSLQSTVRGQQTSYENVADDNYKDQ